MSNYHAVSDREGEDDRRGAPECCCNGTWHKEQPGGSPFHCGIYREDDGRTIKPPVPEDDPPTF